MPVEGPERRSRHGARPPRAQTTCAHLADGTDGGGLGARRPDSALYPGRLTLVGFPGPRERLQHRCWESLESASECRGDSEVGLGCERGRLLEHDRTPFVPARDDVGVERNRAQERDAELPTHPLAAAAAENVCALSTVRAREGAHILDDTEDGDM